MVFSVVDELPLVITLLDFTELDVTIGYGRLLATELTNIISKRKESIIFFIIKLYSKNN